MNNFSKTDRETLFAAMFFILAVVSDESGRSLVAFFAYAVSMLYAFRRLWLIHKEREIRGETEMDRGFWVDGLSEGDGKVYVESDDFTHDVRLYVDGDFADDDEKIRYAKWIAKRLNYMRFWEGK